MMRRFVLLTWIVPDCFGLNKQKDPVNPQALLVRYNPGLALLFVVYFYATRLPSIRQSGYILGFS